MPVLLEWTTKNVCKATKEPNISENLVIEFRQRVLITQLCGLFHQNLKIMDFPTILQDFEDNF